VLNSTLDCLQTQTGFACVQGKSPGRSTVARGEEMLVAGGLQPAELGAFERRSGTLKRIRETQAEAVAFVVCHAIGLGTGSASQKTMLLNALGSLVSDGDQILFIEDTSEIQLKKPNLVRF